MLGALLLNAVVPHRHQEVGLDRVHAGRRSAFDQLEEFAEQQGGIWGARRDVIDRAVRAMIETAECLELLIEPGTTARVTMTFDEYWLDVDDRVSRASR